MSEKAETFQDQVRKGGISALRAGYNKAIDVLLMQSGGTIYGHSELEKEALAFAASVLMERREALMEALSR